MHHARSPFIPCAGITFARPVRSSVVLLLRASAAADCAAAGAADVCLPFHSIFYSCLLPFPFPTFPTIHPIWLSLHTPSPGALFLRLLTVTLPIVCLSVPLMLCFISPLSHTHTHTPLARMWGFIEFPFSQLLPILPLNFAPLPFALSCTYARQCCNCNHHKMAQNLYILALASLPRRNAGSSVFVNIISIPLVADRHAHPHIALAQSHTSQPPQRWHSLAPWPLINKAIKTRTTKLGSSEDNDNDESKLMLLPLKASSAAAAAASISNIQVHFMFVRTQ